MVTLHDLDDSPSSIGPSHRGCKSTDCTSDEHIGEFHSTEQTEHGADQNTGCHEWNPNEDDEPPESPFVDEIALLLGYEFNR